MVQPTSPPKSLLRQVGRAIADYEMIGEGDRVLLGVSGGKDSLSLLHILIHLQRHAPVSFALGAITIDPMVDGFDPSPLRRYCLSLGVPHIYIQQPIMEQARAHMDRDSFCSFCARMKRGAMYTAARREGYGVLALAQHLDDLSESLLMSAFYGGQLRTMKAHYLCDSGDVRVIRPLAYVRERQTADFARVSELPVVPENCPACFRTPTKRLHIKQLLAREEAEHRHLFPSLLHAMRPLMTENSPTASRVGGRERGSERGCPAKAHKTAG